MTEHTSGDGSPRVVAFSATLLVSGVLFINLCGAAFGCGCEALWSAAAANCNVHHGAPPHCPWCVHPGWGGAVAFFSVAAAQATAVFAPLGLGMGTRVVLAFIALPVVGGSVAWLQGLLFGYWG